MLKKIFVAVLAVAFVAGFFANFNSVSEAAGGRGQVSPSNRWRCVACWKLAISELRPNDNTICPETGKPHRYIHSDE